MKTPLIEVKDLRKRYPIYGLLGKLFPPKTHMNAVSGLSLQIYEGETYGLVGESGCGKTTTGRSILGLTKPEEGEIWYRGKNLVQLSDREFRPLRRDIQMVFQDPLSSLSPWQRIGALLEEPLRIQGEKDGEKRRDKVLSILEKVGLSQEHYFRYPHELSGGQVQRMGIARALIIEPKLIVCDEPVSALDVSIQAQILNMLTALQREMGLTLLFISHDMGVVRYLSDRIGVMYLGALVEESTTDELFAGPLHPYTKALFDSIPTLDKHGMDSLKTLEGQIPSPINPPPGCAFHQRCAYACDKCSECFPDPTDLGNGHIVCCHRVHELAAELDAK